MTIANFPIFPTTPYTPFLPIPTSVSPFATQLPMPISPFAGQMPMPVRVPFGTQGIPGVPQNFPFLPLQTPFAQISPFAATAGPVPFNPLIPGMHPLYPVAPQVQAPYAIPQFVPQQASPQFGVQPPYTIDPRLQAASAIPQFAPQQAFIPPQFGANPLAFPVHPQVPTMQALYTMSPHIEATSAIPQFFPNVPNPVTLGVSPQEVAV